MIDSPEYFGLMTVDKKGVIKPTINAPFPYLWLFIVLARSGKIDGGILHVKAATFLEYAKGKKIGSHNIRPEKIDILLDRLSNMDSL